MTNHSTAPGSPAAPPAGVAPGNRTPQRLRAHYEVERELADRLRHADRQQRRTLYAQVYDELFTRVPDHPQLTRKDQGQWRAEHVRHEMDLLGRFLHRDTVFLELGPGDCALSIEAARHVRRVYAVDVSSQITRQKSLPENLEVILSDGTSVPAPAGTVQVAFSDQLMEHLHPDDALEQLHQVFTALAPGGCYLCITPNRLTGPHDISRYFDEEARGFHLKEYTNTELAALMRLVGFGRIRLYASLGGWRLPLWPIVLTTLERLLGMLPRSLRRRLTRCRPLPGLLGIALLARKPSRP